MEQKLYQIKLKDNYSIDVVTPDSSGVLSDEDLRIYLDVLASTLGIDSVEYPTNNELLGRIQREFRDIDVEDGALMIPDGHPLLRLLVTSH